MARDDHLKYYNIFNLCKLDNILDRDLVIILDSILECSVLLIFFSIT